MSPTWGSTQDWPSVAMWLWLWFCFKHLSSRSVRCEAVSRSEFGRQQNSWSVNRHWRRYFVCNSYGDLVSVRTNCSYDWEYERGVISTMKISNSVIGTCTYDLWISNKSIHQSKLRLQVSNTRDNTTSKIFTVALFNRRCKIRGRSNKNISEVGYHVYC
jgi:hypothetical protein